MDRIDPPQGELEAARLLQEVSEGYLEALQARKEFTGADLIARHPELASAIRKRIAFLRLVHHATLGSSLGAGSRQTASSTGGELPEAIGRFEVLAILGRGSFGTVYKARDRDLGRLVAIKVPRTGSFLTREEDERFLREARSAALLRHPGIVQVHEISVESGIPFIVSEYIEGRNLAELILAERPGFRAAADLVAKVADAIAYAHEQKVIHRDIKPANILLDSAGTPHVGDFGLARREEERVTVTIEGQVLGTPAYMPPEQARGEHDKVDGRSDVYSLGVVLFELLTGERPFVGSRTRVMHQVLHDEPRAPRSLNDHIPRDLETICLKAMAKEPGRRYPSAAELAEDLRRFLGGEPIRARPVGRLERSWRWCRRKPAVAGLTASVATLLVSVATVSMVLAVRMKAARDAEKASSASIAQARDEANAQLSRLNVATGFRLMAEGDYLASLAFFAEASRVDRNDPARMNAHRTRFEATLMYAPRLTGAWFLDDPVPQGLFSPDGSRIYAVSGGRVVHVGLPGGEKQVIATPEGESVRRIELSPDGKTLLTSAEGGAIRAWDAESGTGGRLIIQHEQPALRCRFTRDGRRFSTVGFEGVCRVWDIDGREASPVFQNSAPVTVYIFSPDGRRLLLGGKEGSITSWDYESGSQAAWLPPHTSFVTYMASSQDGSKVVTTSDDRTAKIWDASTGKPLGELGGHGNGVWHADFSPDGSRILTASLDGYVRVWDVATRKQVVPPLLHVSGVASAVFTGGGRRIFSAGLDGTARFWDAASGRPLGQVLYHPGGINNAILSPEGRRVFTYCKDSTVKVWDLAGAEGRGAPIDCGGWITDCRLSPDGTRLLTGRLDGAAQIWDLKWRSAVLPRSVRHRSAIQSVAFSADGKMFATASEDGTARAWEATAGKPVTPLLHHGGAVESVAFSPAGSRLATGGKDGSVILWDLPGGERSVQVAHKDAVKQVRFSPDGRWLATASSDRTARMWDAATGAPSTPPLGHTDGVAAAIFSPDGDRLATATAGDGELRTWRVPSGEPLTGPFGRSWGLRHIAFSRDGRSLLVASSSAAARLWDAATGEPSAPEMKHSSGVLHAALSPDESRIITAGYDTKAIVWDAASAEPLAPPMGHSSPVVFAAFLPGGDQVVTVPGGGPARVWPLVSSSRPLDELTRIANMLSGRRIDSRGSMRDLLPGEFRQLWEELRPKYPALFTTTEDEVTAWHVREAEECESAMHWACAELHRRVLLKSNPGDQRRLLKCAELCALQGRYTAAAVDYESAVKLAPLDSSVVLQLATARLAAGDLEGYKQACADPLERFGDTQNARTAGDVAWAACLAPDALGDYEPAIALAGLAVSSDLKSYPYRNTQAVLLYRAGKLEESSLQFEECLRIRPGGTTLDWSFLAMLRHRSGQAEEARTCLEKSRSSYESELAAWKAQPFQIPWRHSIQARLLLQEAEAVVEGR